jgi:hypothetical protein
MPRIRYSRESRSRTVHGDSKLSGETSDFESRPRPPLSQEPYDLVEMASGAIVDIPWFSQHSPGGYRNFSKHCSNRLAGLVTTLGLMLGIVSAGASELDVVVGVDGDVHGAEAERLKLPCSGCSACGVKWSQVTATADVRRYVSWKHTGR